MISSRSFEIVEILWNRVEWRRKSFALCNEWNRLRYVTTWKTCAATYPCKKCACHWQCNVNLRIWILGVELGAAAPLLTLLASSIGAVSANFKKNLDYKVKWKTREKRELLKRDVKSTEKKFTTRLFTFFRRWKLFFWVSDLAFHVCHWW